MVDPLDHAPTASAEKAPRRWTGVLLGFVYCLAYVELFEVLRVWLRWPADLGLFDYILPWVPIPIFLLCVRRAPSWSPQSTGRLAEFAMRLVWCVVLSMISLFLIYILHGLVFRHVMPARHYLSRP
jgi:hypothetical protein